MAKYIDADEALKQIKALQESDPATVGKKQFAEGFFCGLDEAEIILMRTPDVNVAKVVRCKDCKKWTTVHTCKEFTASRSPMRGKITFKTEADDFCSYGERK